MGQYNSRHVIKHVTSKFTTISTVEIEASLRISTRDTVRLRQPYILGISSTIIYIYI